MTIYDYPQRPEMAPIVEHFASIGVNCEFGLIQRWCGLEPLGLLRFGLTPLGGLVTALHESFAGIDEEELIEMTLGWADEWVSRHALYGFEFHTGLLKDSMDETTLRRKLARERFPFLARMLREDLERGDKLFVYRAEEAGHDDKALRLLAAVRGHGPGCLLWVTSAGDAAKIGTVECIEDGLLMGYLDHLAPQRFAAALSFEAWMSVCSDAHTKWREMRPLL